MTDALPDIEEPRAQHAGPRAIEIDLYCLECGYNLRGLYGDPVRCPECGYKNPIGDVEIPAPRIQQQLKRMESAPAVSVFGLLLLLLFLGLIGAMLLSGGAVGVDGACWGIATIAGLATWVTGIVRFRASCLERPGWLGAVARYQLVALLLTAGIAGVFIGVGSLVTVGAGSIADGEGATAYCLVMPVTTLLVVIGIRWRLQPVHRWLRAPMDQLQRAVAVKIARDRIRKEMRDQPKWWKPRKPST